ncbi:CCR4-NOT transcription complex subunit-containing protein [Spironucleus salmonicida]|uniref:CCR4-NOT transcription complex subunit-containing protein n=1 Tax=Spironucleus salmonicida TaxID=348837 RepID=V6LSV7_9EUKA|nr:CCR4-NOT transcription complex subunit-containing protein [Spironucleus salmonicida]|eukprot:EST47727.1 hypothetical protein SS50377_12125 [Spironucleus salmonicida]
MSKSKNKRQQNSEIDRVLRQIDEGLDEFESMWGEFSVNSKQEQQLRSQLQKLQKLRSQVRVWLDDPTLKEYHTKLSNARVLIEAEMRRFKVSEKSIRSKGGDEDYCTGPRAAAIAWADHCCTKLQVEITKLEDEGGKKQKRQREQQAGTYKDHLNILQQIRQGLEESIIEAEDVDNFKDLVDEFIESISSGYQDLDFEIYDDIISIIEQGGHESESSEQDIVNNSQPKILMTSSQTETLVQQPAPISILSPKLLISPPATISPTESSSIQQKLYIGPPKQVIAAPHQSTESISPPEYYKPPQIQTKLSIEPPPQKLLQPEPLKMQTISQPVQLTKKSFAVNATTQQNLTNIIPGEYLTGVEIMEKWTNNESCGLIGNLSTEQLLLIQENQLYSSSTRNHYLQYQLEMNKRSLQINMSQKMRDLDNQIQPRLYQNQETQLSNPELNQRLEKAKKLLLKDPLGSQALKVPQVMKLSTPGESVTQETCLKLETKIFDQIPAEVAFYAASSKNKSRDQYLAGLSLKNRGWHFSPIVGRWVKKDAGKLQFYEFGEGIREVEEGLDGMFDIM